MEIIGSNFDPPFPVRRDLIMAAEQNSSISRLVGELLCEKMIEEQNYQVAMQQNLSQPPNVLKTQGEKSPDWEALYERKGLG